MKYVFIPFAAESRSLSKSDCTRSQLGYGDYLSDNDYSYTYNMFVHDAYYKWSYFTIDDLADKFTKLPYVAGDEIYFVLGSELDKFIEIISKTIGDNFKFVEKSDFYEWALYNGDPRLKEIADNYLKNTKCSYTQFKNINVGEVFKLTGYRDCLYMKVGLLMDTEYPNSATAVLTGVRKGHIIELAPETSVEIVRDLNDVPAECCKGSSLKDLANKYFKDDKDSFMTYSKLPNNPVNYTMADVRGTLELLSWYQNGREISFPLVEKVIFNKPATIVIWADGTKTVVKCQKDKNGKYERYDKEKGLALCYMKKALGNKYDYYNVFGEWIKPEVTGFYDEKHPELGIQDIPPKNTAELPSNQARIKSSELRIIHKYMRDKGLTYAYIAKNSGLSIHTVKRVLTGWPALKTTLLKISGYFDFPIGFTFYVED